VYNVPFRSLEGIARLFARITGIRSVSYTSIFRRIRKILPQLPHYHGKYVDCAIDSTGFKITIRGDYLGTKWNRKRRGRSNLHAVISINDVSVMSFAITDEHLLDARIGERYWKLSWAGLREYSVTRVTIQRRYSMSSD
jgi:hypothetical protein